MPNEPNELPGATGATDADLERVWFAMGRAARVCEAAGLSPGSPGGEQAFLDAAAKEGVTREDMDRLDAALAAVGGDPTVLAHRFPGIVADVRARPRPDPRFTSPVAGMDEAGLQHALNHAVMDLTSGAYFPPGIGLALFVFDFGAGGGLGYISNADRADMVRVFDEWKERTDHDVILRREPPNEGATDARDAESRG